MKICSKCQKEKSFSEFNFKSSTKDQLQPWCRECNRKRSRQYYADNREQHKKTTAQRTKDLVKERQQQLIEYLEEHPCMECGIEDIRVLEFDHVTGIKLYNVSEMIRLGKSWSTMLVEINKCEVVCANCHKIRTTTRGNHYRNIY